MAAFAGKSGSITYASGYAVNVHSWSLDITGDVLESTAFGGTPTFKSFLPGLNSWSGSYEARLDSVETQAALVGQTAAAATFTAMAGVSVAGTIIITGASYAVAVDGIATVTYSFQGSGAPTILPAV